MPTTAHSELNESLHTARVRPDGGLAGSEPQVIGDKPRVEQRSPSASALTVSQIMDQHHTNLMGTVHGGQILNLIDSVAGVVAARHSEGPAVTASIDETMFLQAVRVGDVVHVDARITWAGRSSMEVAVTVTADRWDRAVPATTVATAHLVMVAVDEQGKPRPVAALLPETDDDLRRYREAEIRRRHRLALREALKQGRPAAVSIHADVSAG